MQVFDRVEVEGQAPLDRDMYRALLEALLSARVADDHKAEAKLRQLVDAAPFCQCPACDDRDERREKCRECHGEGFVSDPP